ncbi:YbgA family protein [Desulfovibrio caledoniensis]
MSDPAKERIRIGISACLAGQKVRYDGTNAKAEHLTGVLADLLEFVPVCPEVGCGMGVPREAVRLVGTLEDNRLKGRQTGTDWTDAMRHWAETFLPELEKARLCGFIFKAKSPSSGMGRVKIYSESGGQPTSYAGVGLFASMVMERFPLLPVEDDGRLHDVGLRANFIERIFTEHRWHRFLDSGPTMQRLIEFHTRHKMLVRAHDVTGYREMGKLVAEGKRLPLEELLRRYHARLARAMALKSTVRKNVDVLMHILGYFKKLLTPDEKRECLELIEHYRNESVPLIVPVTLFNHYVRKYDVPYLRGQYYLNPHPLDLKLRNHA